MITIRDIRTIFIAPRSPNNIVVKVETSEPGLYGVGCATFAYRHLAVGTVVDEYLKPLLVGRKAGRIEEQFALMMQNPYWRNGPILNNAIAGVDQALWDIKGKLAGMPVYDLFGGRLREGAAVYRHAMGTTESDLAKSVQAFIEQGVRHIRIQWGGYGGSDEVTRAEGHSREATTIREAT
jgi:mannonate dehydratase